jgi:hypothetical protein
MKFLLLFIGLVCCGAGYHLRQDAERKIISNKWITAGVILIIINLSYLLLGLFQAILVIFILFFILMYKGNLNFWDKDFWDIDFSDMHESRWVGVSIGIIALIFYITYAENLPVTLENGVIEMKGGHGGTFKVSDIHSVDTVSVIQTAGMKRKGKSGNPPSGRFGNFELPNESKTAKLRIRLNNPPYIKIRMNDNSLFILNFKKPDETVEFYNQLKNKL